MTNDVCGPILRQLQIEDIAEDTMRRCHIPLVWPISMEVLIEKLDAVIRIVPNLMEIGAAEAVIERIRQNGEGHKYEVSIDSNIYNGSRPHLQIVLAEEAAHLLVDAVEINSVYSLVDTARIHQRAGWEARELNREKLGRALLLPLSRLEKLAAEVYSQAGVEQGFSSPTNLRMVIVARIASRAMIPIHEAERRLREVPNDLSERILLSAHSRSSVLKRDLYDTRARRVTKSAAPPSNSRYPLFENIGDSP